MKERMTRREMVRELQRLATSGTDLRNGYVLATLDLSQGGEYPQAVSATAAEAWAELCRGITCISVWPDGKPFGCIRFDERGTMHPMHRAPIMFVPATVGADTIRQLGRKTDRLIIIGQQTAKKYTLRNDFHHTRVVVRLVGDKLSASQVRRAWRKLCGMTDCLCGEVAGTRGAQIGPDGRRFDLAPELDGGARIER
jgi:hypothetical protein